MKGLGMLDKGKYGWIERPEPELQNPTDALVEIAAVAMCTSDVHMVNMGNYKSLFGCVIGHEAVGVVTAVGSEVKNFKVGDRVAVNDCSPIGGDYWAQIGLPEYNNNANRTTNPNLDGLFLKRIRYERADNGLCHIPDGVTDEQALMVIDMVQTSMTAVQNANIRPGETVAVIGIGPVGLCAVEECSIMGAGKIIAVGHREACRKVAPEMGASVVIDYAEGPVVDQVKAANGGKPVDVVVICGSYHGVLADAYNLCQAGGRIVNVAMALEPTQEIPMFGKNNISYQGFRCKAGNEYQERLMSLVEHGRLHPEKVISHRFYGYEKMIDAFAKMADKTDDLIKTICIFDEEK